MKGYKAFNKDLTCKGFQYEVGGTYEMDGMIEPCQRGFHFCETIADAYEYYPMSEDTRICEVEALGGIAADVKKFCTDKIKIVREVTEEWRRKGNSNATSTGYCNSGSHNSGNWNSGSRNRGDHNGGDGNSGDWNSGNFNSGNCNSGKCNSGSWNSWDSNSGDWNTGSRNSGNCNSGYGNSGNWNTGRCNSGDRNSGSHNSGNRNSGDWNSGDCNSGCFNTVTPKMMMFNRPSDWTFDDWAKSAACPVVSKFPRGTKWVSASEMSDAEKAANPGWEVTDGYLKDLGNDAAAMQRHWDSLGAEDKEAVLSLPNFDRQIFKECTGIDVGGEDAPGAMRGREAEG